MVYIIDDDKSVRRGFSILLKSAGFVNSAHESVEDFLAHWTRSSKDVVILDMHMPGMDGRDFLKYLVQEKLFVNIIVVTAYDEPESREISKNYGALAYLRKPVDGEALIDLIKYAQIEP